MWRPGRRWHSSCAGEGSWAKQTGILRMNNTTAATEGERITGGGVFIETVCSLEICDFVVKRKAGRLEREA
jgi:hypothetical protein